MTTRQCHRIFERIQADAAFFSIDDCSIFMRDFPTAAPDPNRYHKWNNRRMRQIKIHLTLLQIWSRRSRANDTQTSIPQGDLRIHTGRRPTKKMWRSLSPIHRLYTSSLPKGKEVFGHHSPFLLKFLLSFLDHRRWELFFPSPLAWLIAADQSA